MNYRHIYHAGNFADVLKHIVLMQILKSLRKKEKPFFVLDAHAGIGRYDLSGEKHQKTKESDAGVNKISEDISSDGSILEYVEFIKKYGAGKYYPGSPEIIRSLLRDQDRAVFNELHPEDFETLKSLMYQHKKTRVENMDAYACMKSLLPPPIKRGLILIDPPFEEKNEFELMANGVKQAYKKFSNGVYALWYPIKDKDIVENFYNSLKSDEIKDILIVEFFIDRYEQGKFSGTGLVLVNPPWGLKENLENMLPILSDKLSNGKGSWLVKGS